MLLAACISCQEANPVELQFSILPTNVLNTKRA
jgi:hypothetical protein